MLINYGSCIISLQHSTGGMYTLTIVPTPSTAEVSLIATGYIQAGNSIRVPANTQVKYEVYEQGYVISAGVVTVTADQTLNINLETGVLCTINPTPADATVTFIIDGYEYQVEENALEVPINRSFGYRVEKEYYQTQSVTTTISTPTTINVQLNPLTPVDLSDYTYEIDEHEDAILTEYTGNDTDPTVP